MLKKISYLFLILLIFSGGCNFFSRDIYLTILFKNIGDLNENSPVIWKNIQIGKVKDIDMKGNKIAVKIQIFKEYKEQIKVQSDFYCLGKGNNAHIQVEVNNPKSAALKNDITLEGTTQTKYFIKKGYKKTRDFLNSPEWKKFQKDVSEQINKAAKKGKESFDKQLPIIKEKAKELFEKSPEMLERAKAYIDSLAKENKKKEN